MSKMGGKRSIFQSKHKLPQRIREYYVGKDIKYVRRSIRYLTWSVILRNNIKDTWALVVSNHKGAPDSWEIVKSVPHYSKWERDRFYGNSEHIILNGQEVNIARR